MTDRTRKTLWIGFVTLAPIIFGAGAGVSAAQGKLVNVATALDSLSAKITRIDARVSAIYCSSIPEPQRAACR